MQRGSFNKSPPLLWTLTELYKSYHKKPLIKNVIFFDVNLNESDLILKIRMWQQLLYLEIQEKNFHDVIWLISWFIFCYKCFFSSFGQRCTFFLKIMSFSKLLKVDNSSRYLLISSQRIMAKIFIDASDFWWRWMRFIRF